MSGLNQDYPMGKANICEIQANTELANFAPWQIIFY
jgi:hypothetical protein